MKTSTMVIGGAVGLALLWYYSGQGTPGSAANQPIPGGSAGGSTTSAPSGGGSSPSWMDQISSAAGTITDVAQNAGTALSDFNLMGGFSDFTNAATVAGMDMGLNSIPGVY